MPESHPDGAGRSSFGRFLPLLVPVVLVAAAVAAFLVSRESVDEQEDRLLRLRTSEVELVLANAVEAIPASLRSLGVAARLGDDPERAFLAEARASGAATGEGADVALVRLDGSTPVVVASLGDAPGRGTRLQGQPAAAVRRALADPELAPTTVFGEDERRLGFALGPPTSPSGTVIYREMQITPQAEQTGRQEAFADIKAVLYATSDPRPDQIVVTTTPDTLRGDDVARGTVTVGNRRWLLLTSPREPLVGSFATIVPWIVLGAGLLGALMATAVTVTLLRRRDYALGLVDERTAELQQSVAALRDTQERLVVQERLAAIGQVAAAVGHELRNPLGPLTNALKLIRARLPVHERESLAPHIDAAEREIATVATTVETLLDYAREREPATAPIALGGLVEEALSAAPPPPDVAVRRSGLDRLPAVRGDRRQLRHVLLNVLANAYEAMQDGGTLTLEAAPDGDLVALRIADTGVGMDASTAASAFEPFFSTKERGIGLGLSVSRRIVESHGGTIRAEPTAATGTQIVLTVPRAGGGGDPLREDPASA